MPQSHIAFVLLLAASSPGVAQNSSQSSLSALLQKTEATASLTSNGSPFHAEMRIAGNKHEPPFEAEVLVDWASPTRHRVEVRSPQFHQVEIVDGTQVQDDREGDFCPGWLHAFVSALVDPVSVKTLLLDPNAALSVSRSSNGQTVTLCITRDNDVAGIRDDLTWSGLCVNSDGLLTNVHDFSSWMDFSDQKSFAGKKIARTYSTSTGSYDQITGRLTSLRDLKPTEADAIHVTQPTPPAQQLGFTLISTKAQESRLESAKPFDWPTVREGKTEGYMIVNALTDVTGQVRETSKYNSDNPGLEEAGRQAALGYKFKPMLVNGVPVQMEMPLVLHFSSKVADPLPILTGVELLGQIKGCDARLATTIPTDAAPTRISVNEDGKLTGESYGSQVQPGTPAVLISFPPSELPQRPHGLVFDCRFLPLKRNGVITYYHGDLFVIGGGLTATHTR
jgi:hypothetical protein